MIKNKCKKIVSAMLIMTMIATMYSTNVFADDDIIADICENGAKGCMKGCIKACIDMGCCPCINNDDLDYNFDKDTGTLILLGTYTETGSIAPQYTKDIRIVTIKRGVRRLVGTFQNCYNLTSVTISDTVKEIGENAFADCKELEFITIPASVTKIGAYAFKGCTGLKTVTISSSSTEIDENAFYECTVEIIKPPKPDPQPAPPKSDVVLDPITPPTNIISTEVTKVDNSAQACVEIAKIDNSAQASEEVVIDNITPPTNIIPTEVTKVDNSAQACVEIAKIDNSAQVSEEVDKINSFIQTSEIEVVIDPITPPTNIIPTEVAKTDNSAQTCKESPLLQIPEYIGCCGDNVYYLFYESAGKLVIHGKGEMVDYSYSKNSPWHEYKNKIKSVNVEDGVTYIGGYSFNECTSLTSVTINNGKTRINKTAFRHCINLKSIDLKG